MQQPLWLAEAWRELGQREQPGSADNPRILALYRDAGHAEIRHDETAWCAAFAGACLERAGVSCSRSLMARSYATWGAPLDDGRLGAVAVLTRGSDSALGHVGFLLGETADEVILLGGNQGDAVSVAAFAKSRLIALRWPAEQIEPGAPSEADDTSFTRALAHVLELEGGWSDDPYDPGGATNFGITIGEFASWRDLRLDSGTLAKIKTELRHISPETVREIYRRRYWQAARCAELPGALAFMHFDAAVNHGVGTAIRSLQEAVRTETDGEIGPLTREAIARTDIKTALARYAEIRQRRYRALSHFWRFGKGWLRRVDSTLARALEIAGNPRTRPDIATEGVHDMMDAPVATPAPKWWGHSLTVWGALITALSTVLPVLGPLIGLDITPDIVRDAGNQIVLTVQALAGLFGTLMTIYGRLRATQPLTRRAVSLRL